MNILIMAPVILVMVLDLVFTLAGQPDYYWQNYDFFNEGSPLGQIIMPAHPAYFILFFVFYLVFVVFILSILPKPLNIMTALSFFLGHVWGSSTWLGTIYYKITGNYFAANSWYLDIGYFIILAIISSFFINKWLKLKYEE